VTGAEISFKCLVWNTINKENLPAPVKQSIRIPRCFFKTSVRAKLSPISPVWAQLRASDTHASDTHASAGTCEALEKIVPAIRKRFPKARPVVRADSGFSREAILAWCEAQKGVYYLIGMARNARLETLLAPALRRAQERHWLTGVPCREFLESE
jgi:hypothetical protein